MPNSIWVPPNVQAQYVDKRREFQAELEEKLVRHGALAEYNKLLKDIDPYLEVVWAPESVPEDHPVLKPNRYHLLRHNPGAPPTVEPYEGPDGEFLELSSGLFDFVRRMDLWRDELQKDRKKHEQALEHSKERQKARETEDRQSEIAFRLKAKESPGVLFGSNKWTNRAGARRRGTDAKPH